MITSDIKLAEIHELENYLKYVPYDVSRNTLYNAESLYSGFDLKHPETKETCYDSKVYQYYMQTGKHAYSAKESLARCLHDYGITKALDSFLADFDPKSVIGIMGGH